MSGWLTLLYVATALGQVMLNLSLGPDMYTIHRRRNIGEILPLPLVSMLVNCHLWMCYGILRDSIFPTAASQAVGQLAAIVFNAVYFKWSPAQTRKDAFKLYVGGAVLHCLVTLYFVLVLAGVTGQSNHDGSNVLGYAAVVVNVCMFASPLATLKHVVRTKSASSIPIDLSVMIFASSALWVATGLLDSDYFITGLNAAGVVLGGIQMVLYYIYRPGRGVDVLPDREYGAIRDQLSAVSPTSKSAIAQSPSYKPFSSPVDSKTA